MLRLLSRRLFYSRCLLLLGLLSALQSCAPAEGSAGALGPAPAPARAYSTSARSGGVADGDAARAARSIVETELMARGDLAQPDGVLAATAAEVLRAIYASGATANPTGVEAVARRLGFAGIVLGFAAVGVDRADAPALLHDLFASVPSNRRVTRYGIIAGHNHDVGIVLGAVEATLDDFPRALAPGSTLHLHGEVAELYERASVFATSPNGSVRELAMPSRAIDASIELSARGTYKLEVMGYGKTGPVVLINVPVQAGTLDEAAPEEAAGDADPALTAEAAEARILTLLNRTREQAQLAPLSADAELRAVALAHSQDMSANNFFGHVSPTTGSFEERARRANLRGSKFGECLALEVTPEGAQRSLLQSPAHRATMLDPSFTNVGIGVAFREQAVGHRALVVTLFFARYPPLSETRVSADGVVAALQQYRKARALPPLGVDPVLTLSARAGARALEGAEPPSRDRGVAAAQAELRRQVQRTRRGRTVCFSIVDIIERAQLASQPVPMSPLATRVGVGVSEFQDDKGPRLMVLMALEGDPDKPIDCR